MSHFKLDSIHKAAAAVFALLAILLVLFMILSGTSSINFEEEVYVGRVGDTIRVTIEVEDATFQAYELTFVTDSTVAKPVSHVGSGYITESWTAFANIKGTDTLLVSAASVAAIGITDPTVIFALDYVITGEGTIPIEVLRFKLDESDYNLPEASIEGQPPLLYGDADEDGDIDSMDAVRILEHSVGISFIPGSQQPAADVTDNGTVSALDAALVLQWTVNIINCFPAEVGCE
jgi:hypothetical protein